MTNAYRIEVDAHTHPTLELPVFAYVATHGAYGVIASGDAPTALTAYNRAFRQIEKHFAGTDTPLSSLRICGKIQAN
jgi:hypothetical protein